MVFDDDDATRGDEVRGVKECEDFLVVGGFFVGWIEEEEIGEQAAGGNFFQAAQSWGLDQLRGGPNVERFEIFADQARGFGARFDEDCFARAAADGFDAYGAGSGEEVNEEGIFYGRAENVEEGFAQAIAGGAKALRARAF